MLSNGKMEKRTKVVQVGLILTLIFSKSKNYCFFTIASVINIIYVSHE